MKPKTTKTTPPAAEREKGTREDGEAMPPQAADPKAAESASSGSGKPTGPSRPTPGSAEGERDTDDQSR
jgi:hypothetical protein